MQKFQDLLTEAAQLKQQQLKQERKNFQALPEYLKSGLNYAKKYIQLRKQHYLVQKYISQKLKKEGNQQYLLQNYGQALSKYQEALSIFRYIHATKYENLKDQDIIYENYKPQNEFKQEHESHLVALYLNICSALTKMNKKDEAIHSSEQALKIKEDNGKAYYKKAQAYLQYINRESSDIKVGFYFLNKAYELSKDQSILVQMHKIKKELDEQREKEKNWFKFMFDKSKSANDKEGNNQKVNDRNNSKVLQNVSQLKKTVGERGDNDIEGNSEKVKNYSWERRQKTMIDEIKSKKMKQQLNRFRQQSQQNQNKDICQQQKLQKNKLSLKPYLIIPRDDRWIIKYQEDFIHKHGSKIYSILQLYNQSDYLIQFKSLLAKCLELKQAKITPQRDETKLLQEKISMYQKLIQWIKTHPLQKYQKYIQRYHLQTQWIINNRGKPLDQVFIKESKQNKIKINQPQLETKYQKNSKNVSQNSNRINQTTQQFFQVRKTSLSKGSNVNKVKSKIQREINVKRSKEGRKQNKDHNQKKFQFKQQWEYEYQKDKQQQSQGSFNQDQVPSNLKAYLQNYQQLPTFSTQQPQTKNNYNPSLQQRCKQKQSQDLNPESQLKQNPLTFIKTFIIIILLVAFFKIIF